MEKEDVMPNVEGGGEGKKLLHLDFTQALGQGDRREGGIDRRFFLRNIKTEEPDCLINTEHSPPLLPSWKGTGGREEYNYKNGPEKVEEGLVFLLKKAFHYLPYSRTQIIGTGRDMAQFSIH